MLWLALLPLIAACWHDLRTREIPDRAALALLAGAVAACAAGLLGHSWGHLLFGLGLGFLATAPLFYVGGLGGGDVKLITALGAWLGPWGLLATLLWIALAGLVLSVWAACRGQRELAYAPAIAGGVLFHLLSPTLLPDLLAR